MIMIEMIFDGLGMIDKIKEFGIYSLFVFPFIGIFFIMIAGIMGIKRR